MVSHGLVSGAKAAHLPLLLCLQFGNILFSFAFAELLTQATREFHWQYDGFDKLDLQRRWSVSFLQLRDSSKPSSPDYLPDPLARSSIASVDSLGECLQRSDDF